MSPSECATVSNFWLGTYVFVSAFLSWVWSARRPKRVALISQMGDLFVAKDNKWKELLEGAIFSSLAVLIGFPIIEPVTIVHSVLVGVTWVSIVHVNEGLRELRTGE